MNRLGEVVKLDEGRLHHVEATPHPPLVLSDRVAPVTEIWLISFPATCPERHQREFEEKMLLFLEVMEKQQIFRGSARGWVLEPLDTGHADSQMSMAYQVFIGWESLSAIQRFQETSTWVNAYLALEDARDLGEIKLVYYSGIQSDRES